VALTDRIRSSPSHMKGLYDGSRAHVKIWKDFPGGQHNDTVAEPHYFEYIADFIVNQVMHPR